MYSASAIEQPATSDGRRMAAGFAMLVAALAIVLASALGAQSAHADELVTGEVAKAPAKVTIASFKSKAAGKATVKVKMAAGATGYQYRIARNKSFTKGKKSKKNDSRTITFKGLAEGKTYYVKARAYKLVDGTKVWGPWSKVKKTRIRKSAGETYVDLHMTLDQMASWQPPYTAGVKLAEVRKLLDPANIKSGTAAYYQFASLKGYSGLTAEQIDNYISSTDSGNSGMLKGKGAAFVEAAKAYNVNECYLVSHAILESGWGTSELAKGFKYKGKTYYNFYGIGAYDGNALSGGRGAAVKYDWTSPEKAIMGAAEYVSTYYIARDPYPQDTLYGMKWDYLYSNDFLARGWHQYASDPYWPSKISTLMNELYAHAGFNPSLEYKVPLYKS